MFLSPSNKTFSIVSLIIHLLIYFSNATLNRHEKIVKNKLNWWKNAVIYQIYPRSFKDSDNDGIGDLKGIEEEVQYFRDIEVDCIWLTPIYKSPMANFGYDISDFKSIDSIFGTIDDFTSLVNTLKMNDTYLLYCHVSNVNHFKGETKVVLYPSFLVSLTDEYFEDIKIIMDFIPNHTSDEHEWFKKSVNKIDPYTDYYVWRDAEIIDNGIRVEPNNWKSVFNTPAWTFNETRGQYYLHQFHKRQPDLNFRNPNVVNEILSTMRFWLDLGINGFRIDAVGFLFEDNKFSDEPKKYIAFNYLNPNFDQYDLYEHLYTVDLKETYDMVSRFREVLDEYSRKDGITRIIITEAYTTLKHALEYYGDDTHPRAHLPFNFLLINDLNYQSKASDFNEVVRKWMDNKPINAWANWAIGNHDNARVATRFGSEMVDAMNMLNLLLPGTAFTYMGEEIGLEDAEIIDPNGQNSLEAAGRIYYRVLNKNLGTTLEQWNVSKSSGLTFYSNTWLPVNPNYWKIKLDKEKKLKYSHYKVYQRLAALRKTPLFQHGSFEGYELSDWVYVFSRSLNGETYLVVMNVGTSEELVVLTNWSAIDSSTSWLVHTSSINSGYYIGKTCYSDGFKMKPKSALVLYKAKLVSFSELITTPIFHRLD